MWVARPETTSLPMARNRALEEGLRASGILTRNLKKGTAHAARRTYVARLFGG